MRRIALALAFALVSLSLAMAQETAKTRFDRGLAAFQTEKYREALDAFGSVLADPKAADLRPDALYWTALSASALGDLSTAEKSIQTFLASYPNHPRVPDLLYQKGRVLFGKADYQGALGAFAAFMTSAPAADLYPAALYWSGECLYALGRLDDAKRAFVAVVERFPASVKVEASAYRRDLIDLEFREEELLKLLTWSHEEALRNVEDFRRKERAYEQSIAVYQKELGDLKRGAVTDADKTMADLRAQVADLTKKLAVAQSDLTASRAENEALRGAISRAQADAAAAAAAAAKAGEPVKTAAPGSAVPTQAVLSAEVLAAKARALDLLAFYLSKLSGGGVP